MSPDPPRADVVFDGIGSAFEADIYGTSKGYIRMGVLWADLLEEIAEISGGSLSVLDAGGGAGHLAVRLAQLGNRVVLAEPSGEMIERARTAVTDAGLGERVRLIQAPIQDLAALIDGQFDLVICHAVLEWVADPAALVESLAQFVKPGGSLSLLFYNRNARVLKEVLAGSYDTSRDSFGVPAGGWGDGATPLAEGDVRMWLAAAGLRVTSRAGVRIFHDLLGEEQRTPALLPDLLATEISLRRTQPFASLAQHIHLVAQRSIASWPADWEARRAGRGCIACDEGRPDEIPPGRRIFAGTTCDAYLFRDTAARGYTVVFWRGRHVAEPTDLTEEEGLAFWRELLLVSRAIEAQFQPAKLNFLWLGNSMPHLHVHVVPRYLDDPDPGRPPRFMMEDRSWPLVPEAEYERQVAALRTRMATTE